MKELFPEKYSVLVQGPPGVGKFEYCLDLLEGCLKKEEKVIFITTERSPSEIKRRALNAGLDLDEYESKKFLFIDAYSWAVEEKYDKGFNVGNPANLNELSINMDKATEALGKPARVFFDSLSPLFLHNQPAVVTKAVQLWTSRAKGDYGFVLYTLQDGVHDPQVVKTLVYLVDGYIEMEFEEEEELVRKMRIHHLKGMATDARWRIFDIANGRFKLK